MICCPHVFHLLIYELLHLDHVLLLLASIGVHVIRQDLERFRECIHFASDLVAQVTDSCDVFEDLLLLVLEVLVEALRVR